MINNHQPLCCPKCLSTKIEFLTESHKAIIIGKGGSKLKQIGSEARVDIEKLLSIK